MSDDLSEVSNLSGESVAPRRFGPLFDEPVEEPDLKPKKDAGERERAEETRGGNSMTITYVIGALWAVCVAIGGLIVGLFSRLTGKNALKTKNGQNYYDIVKPSIAPMPALFVVLWTIFFLLYGFGGVAMISPWLVSGVGRDKLETARLSICVVLYVVILGLLYAWMPVFANMERPKTAAFLLIGILILYVPLLVLSYKTVWWSAALLAPLFGWLIVAMVMNAESVQKWITHNNKQIKQQVNVTMTEHAQNIERLEQGKTIDLGVEANVSGRKMEAAARDMPRQAFPQPAHQGMQAGQEQNAMMQQEVAMMQQVSHHGGHGMAQVPEQGMVDTAASMPIRSEVMQQVMRKSPHRREVEQKSRQRREQSLMSTEQAPMLNPMRTEQVPTDLDTSAIEMVTGSSYGNGGVEMNEMGRMVSAPSSRQNILPAIKHTSGDSIEL